MHLSCREIKAAWDDDDPGDSRSAIAASSSMAIRSLSTFIRSLKKSMFTRCANLDIPDNAAGRRGVGVGFFNIRK